MGGVCGNTKRPKYKTGPHKKKGVQNWNDTPQAAAYGQKFNYQQQNYQNFTPHPVPFPQQSIPMYSEQLFAEFDSDFSGDIDIMEFPRLIAAFYKVQNLHPPDKMTINWLMNTYDYDRNGRISFMEWRDMLQYLGGHQQPGVQVNQQYVQQQRVQYGQTQPMGMPMQPGPMMVENQYNGGKKGKGGKGGKKYKKGKYGAAYGLKGFKGFKMGFKGFKSKGFKMGKMKW
jgi:hypothetical protein